MLKKLKLSKLSEAMLKDKEMSSLLGGESLCTCSCYYEGEPGGSSNFSNMVANLDTLGPDGHSAQGCNNYFAFTYEGTLYYTTLAGTAS